MTYLISGFLISINAFSSLFGNKSRVIKLLLLIMMWILFWGNFQSADYSNYLMRYNYIMQTGNIITSNQIGFWLLMKIATIFGLEYNQFLMLLSILALLLIVSTVEKFTTKPQLVYILYFIYPFLLDIVQVRHFLAMAIVVFSLRYLSNDGIQNSIKFIIGILIAYSIHYISIIFIPLILLKNIKIKKLYLIIFIFLIIGIPLAYTNLYQIIASYFVPLKIVELYFSDRVKIGFLLQFFIQTVIFVMVHLSKRFLEKNESTNQFINTIYKTNLYLFLLFPLYIINGTFERAYRMIFIPNCIIFSIAFTKTKKNTKVLFLMVLLVFVFILFIYYIYIPSRCTVFFPVFENNLLIK